MIFGIGVKGCSSEESSDTSSTLSTTSSYTTSSKASSSSSKSSSSSSTSASSVNYDYSYAYEGDFRFTVWTRNGVFDYCAVSARYTTLSGEVTVPSTYGSYPVTQIDYGAFSDCTQITYINIPGSITYVSAFAFDKCTKLFSFRVDSGNTRYYTDGGILYNSFSNSIVKFPAGKDGPAFTIPSNITRIESEAFGDTKISSLYIPTSVTYIGGWVFEFATSLKTLNYSGTKSQWNSIEKFEYWKQDSSLTSVVCTDGTIYL